MRGLLLAGVFALAMTGDCRASSFQDFNFGVAARNRDDADATIKYLTSALQGRDLLPALKPAAYLGRGEAYLASANYDAAIADFSSALQAKPGYIEAYLNRASAYRHKKQYDLALADLASIVRLRPRYPDSYYRSIAIYEDLGRFDDELAESNAVLAQWPRDPALFVLRSDVYAFGGKYALAIADASGALALDPKYAGALSARGQARQLSDDTDGALDDFSDAIDLESNNPELQLDKGFAEWQAARFDKAIGLFRRLLELSPTSRWGMLGLEISRRRAGQRTRGELEKQTQSLDLTEWPGPIIGLFLGKLTPDQVRAAAADGDGRMVLYQQCQADFFLGEWSHLQGDAPSSRAAFEHTANSCAPDMVERAIARAELKNMPAADGKS
jgi:tetratricopeptide (TPR) repeat protein